jgi:cyclopropane-fatty-acyl-phospholipid synthase
MTFCLKLRLFFKFYETYFRLVDFALKSENATIVCSASSFPESRYGQYQGEDFMRKYMWPNCHLPSATALVDACHKGAQGRFTLESIENHAARKWMSNVTSGPCASVTNICAPAIIDYPRTLREWGRRLEKNLTQSIIAKDYPSLNNPQEYEAFKRKWQYLFAYAGSGFAHGYLTCHMWTFHRQNDKPIACD